MPKKEIDKKNFRNRQQRNLEKLRRAMKTFIIMDRSFIEKLSSNLEKAGIPS